MYFDYCNIIYYTKYSYKRIRRPLFNGVGHGCQPPGREREIYSPTSIYTQWTPNNHQGNCEHQQAGSYLWGG